MNCRCGIWCPVDPASRHLPLAPPPSPRPAPNRGSSLCCLPPPTLSASGTLCLSFLLCQHRATLRTPTPRPSPRPPLWPAGERTPGLPGTPAHLRLPQGLLPRAAPARLWVGQPSRAPGAQHGARCPVSAALALGLSVTRGSGGSPGGGGWRPQKDEKKAENDAQRSDLVIGKL